MGLTNKWVCAESGSSPDDPSRGLIFNNPTMLGTTQLHPKKLPLRPSLFFPDFLENSVPQAEHLLDGDLIHYQYGGVAKS